MGSLHATSAAAPFAVILLNQGPVDRGGSHRLYIKLANRLTRLGIPVLRFDARGVGESEGRWEGEDQGITIPQVYGQIQRGAWKPDAMAAIDFMQRATGVKQVVLGGLCGGAATALFAGADHPAVEGMFVIGTPITFSSATQRVADLPDAIIARDTFGYLKKLLKPSSWARFLSFQSDYSTLVHVFMTQLKRRFGRLGASAATEDAIDENINAPLLQAVRTTVTRRKRLLVVYGENDYLWQEFQEQMHRFGPSREQLPFQLVTIPDANHTLTEESWQHALFAAVTTWIEEPAQRLRRHLA
jgi:pimeloyl-ACP methyl ester carboxylesterase